MKGDTWARERVQVRLAMVKFGGSFVKALGRALDFADARNAKKVKAAFPEYWDKYKKLAEDGYVKQAEED